MRARLERPKALDEDLREWTESERHAVLSYVEAVEDYVYGLEQSVLLFVYQRDVGLSPSAPPHDVPCPRCLAFALEPCRTEKRLEKNPRTGSVPGPWPDSSLLTPPHEERKRHRQEHPEFVASEFITRKEPF